ncbi:MAG: hypothetical protein V4717_13620 [Bacteroidota bacterium]
MQKQLISFRGFSFYIIVIACFLLESCSEPVKENSGNSLKKDSVVTGTTIADEPGANTTAIIDTVLYNKKMLQLVHDSADSKWPVKAPYPLAGAILPFNRIVAFYGNFYSKGMGILGEIPTTELIAKLQTEVQQWQLADSTTPVIPAIHYIAVTAQKTPGKDGMYRLRMPFAQIDKAISLADTISGLVFLDIQVGKSTLQAEIPRLQQYLQMPNVHLGIDPEFSMKTGAQPGSQVGTFDAEDINFAASWLADLVAKNKLPPKILVIHRFTQQMVTNYKNIKTRPEVQFVIDMDGFGFPAKKVNTYISRITNEPVQFSGFKLFYKNDIDPPKWKKLMEPKEILALRPSPVYIQYQ